MKTKNSKSLGLGLLCLALGMGATGNAAAQQLQAHIALYKVELADARGATSLADASGLIGFEWQASCEAYSTSQRFYTRFTTTEGLSSSSDIQFSAEEATDGSSFAFDITDSVNGRVSEHTVGQVGNGVITFTSPDPARGSLPADTLFPTQQSAQLIAAALAGQTHMETRVFDGGDEDEVYDTVATIYASPRDYLPHPESEGAVGLVSLQSWYVTMSYYDIGGRGTLPNYEISYRLFSNGIVDEIRMDYGDYAFSARMMQLDLFDQPDC